MAKRRGFNWGKAFTQAAQPFGGLADYYMRRQLEQLQQQAMMERQKAEAEERRKAADTLFQRQIQQQVLNHPDQANRLAQRGVGAIGGVPTDTFRPTGSEVAGPILKDLGGVKSLTELPPLSGSANQYAAGLGEDKMLRNVPLMLPGGGSARLPMTPRSGADLPPLTSIIQASQGKQQILEDEAQQAENAKERYDPTEGSKYFLGRSGEKIPTGPTGFQAGEQKREELLAGELDPDVLKAREEQAGAVAGAQMEASTEAQIQTRHKYLKELSDIAEAMSVGRQGAGGGANAKQSAETMMALGKQMVQVADFLNTTGGIASRGVGIKNWIQSKFGYNDPAKWLDDTVNGTAIMFASSLGHVGVKTQQDVDSTKRIMPTYGLTPTENANRNKTFLDLVIKAEQLGAQLGPIDPNLPVEQQSAEYQRRLQMLLNQVSRPPGLDEPSTEPAAGGVEYDVMPDGTIKPRRRGGY